MRCSPNFEREARYSENAIWDVSQVKKSNIFCVSSRLSVQMLYKHLRSWEYIISRMEFVDKPNPYSIISANMNIRKIQMILMVKGKWIAPSFEYGRTQYHPEVRHYILKKFNFKCVECGATNKETTLHIDHIKPIVNGGSNNEDNLQVLCKKCNQVKHTDEWKGGQ